MRLTPDPSWTDPVADPQTPGDGRANLEHTLQVFREAADDQLVLVATSNIYGPGIRTGLTMRDLRLVAEWIGCAK